MTKILHITRKILTVIFSIFTFLFLLLAIYNFFSVKILKNDYSNVFGYTVFEVVSGSMSPTIEKWDLILVKVGADYKEGDVITYTSDGSIITHRVIEKNGDVLIAKGDANNTVDSPVNTNKVIGKVVKTYRHLGAWIKVMTTPKVMVLSLISLVLVLYTISTFKQDKEIEKKKTKKEKKMVIEITNRIKIELAILVILLFALLFLVPYTLSRFKTNASGDVEIDVALYVTKDTYNYQNLTLNEMKPGDTYEYTFSVSNNKDGVRTEVVSGYTVSVIATTNVPLDYELKLINSGLEQNVVDNTSLAPDDDGTYFKKLVASERTFDYDTDVTDYYKLIVKYPSTASSYQYQDTAENIEIRVDGKQILDTDN